MTEPNAAGTTSCDAQEFAAFLLRRRAVAALNRAGITTVGQLRTLLDRGKLDEVVNLGAKSLASLAEAVTTDLGDQDPISRLERPRPLSARDRKILRLRSRGATLGEIANKTGISRERVRQILTTLT